MLAATLSFSLGGKMRRKTAPLRKEPRRGKSAPATSASGSRLGGFGAQCERFFTASRDLLCIASRDGYFKYLSPSFTQTLGWPLDALLARPFIDWVHPDDRAPTMAAVERYFTAGPSDLRLENRCRHQDGSWRVLSWSSAPPQAGGLVYATARDITQEHTQRTELTRAKEQADAANRAKSAFLATMSHEIRTPLYGVLGMLDLMSLSPLDPEQRASVDIMRKSGQGLQRIIDDMLDFSKIEAGRLEIVPEVLSIAALVGKVRNTYARSASSKGVTLEQHVDPHISPALRADGLRVEQILNNFVSNALKFTTRGEVAIRAELMARTHDADTVQLTVKDTGIGIAMDNQRRLFQPFVQAERDTDRRYGGTGLGLTICRRLAELMGGKVELHSELGIGTAVSLTLPLPIADSSMLSAEVANENLPTLRGTPPTIAEAQRDGTLVLIIDDHPINRKLLKMQVNCLGYAAEVASDGSEGMQEWETGRYALVLADCHMPIMDGYEFARRIRKHEALGGLGHVPIIACSASALREDCEACTAAGMDDYLPKPIDLAALAAKLAHWLPRRRAAA